MDEQLGQMIVDAGHRLASKQEQSRAHNVALADHGQAGVHHFRAAEDEHRPFDIVITESWYVVYGRPPGRSRFEERITDHPGRYAQRMGRHDADRRRPSCNVDAIIAKPPQIEELRDTLHKLCGAPS